MMTAKEVYKLLCKKGVFMHQGNSTDYDYEEKIGKYLFGWTTVNSKKVNLLSIRDKIKDKKWFKIGRFVIYRQNRTQHPRVGNIIVIPDTYKPSGGGREYVITSVNETLRHTTAVTKHVAPGSGVSGGSTISIRY